MPMISVFVFAQNQCAYMRMSLADDGGAVGRTVGRPRFNVWYCWGGSATDNNYARKLLNVQCAHHVCAFLFFPFHSTFAVSVCRWCIVWTVWVYIFFVRFILFETYLVCLVRILFVNFSQKCRQHNAARYIKTTNARDKWMIRDGWWVRAVVQHSDGAFLTVDCGIGTTKITTLFLESFALVRYESDLNDFDAAAALLIVNNPNKTIETPRRTLWVRVANRMKKKRRREKKLHKI